jgi:hypothetical protein
VGGLVLSDFTFETGIGKTVLDCTVPIFYPIRERKDFTIEMRSCRVSILGNERLSAFGLSLYVGTQSTAV